MQLILLSKCIT